MAKTRPAWPRAHNMTSGIASMHPDRRLWLTFQSLESSEEPPARPGIPDIQFWAVEGWNRQSRVTDRLLVGEPQKRCPPYQIRPSRVDCRDLTVLNQRCCTWLQFHRIIFGPKVGQVLFFERLPSGIDSNGHFGPRAVPHFLPTETRSVDISVGKTTQNWCRTIVAVARWWCRRRPLRIACVVRT